MNEVDSGTLDDVVGEDSVNNDGSRQGADTADNDGGDENAGNGADDDGGAGKSFNGPVESRPWSVLL